MHFLRGSKSSKNKEAAAESSSRLPEGPDDQLPSYDDAVAVEGSSSNAPSFSPATMDLKFPAVSGSAVSLASPEVGYQVTNLYSDLVNIINSDKFLAQRVASEVNANRTMDECLWRSINQWQHTHAKYNTQIQQYRNGARDLASECATGYQDVSAHQRTMATKFTKIFPRGRVEIRFVPEFVDKLALALPPRIRESIVKTTKQYILVGSATDQEIIKYGVAAKLAHTMCSSTRGKGFVEQLLSSTTQVMAVGAAHGEIVEKNPSWKVPEALVQIDFASQIQRLVLETYYSFVPSETTGKPRPVSKLPASVNWTLNKDISPHSNIRARLTKLGINYVGENMTVHNLMIGIMSQFGEHLTIGGREVVDHNQSELVYSIYAFTLRSYLDRFSVITQQMNKDLTCKKIDMDKFLGFRSAQ